MTRPNRPSDFWRRVEIKDEASCWTWTGHKHRQGYGRFKLFGKLWLTHRLSWFLQFGALEPDVDLCHRCDNPTCVNPHHLFRGSHLDNMRDMVRKGRHVFGTKMPFAKLNDDIVREIRRLYAAGGLSHRDLAKRFGVDNARISRIINGKIWRHVQDVAA